MINVYRRAGETRICETRLESDGSGLELVVVDAQGSHVERFDDARAMASREHELRHAWLLHGWRTIESDVDVDEGE